MLNLQDQIFDFRRGIGDTGYNEALVIGYLNKAKREIAKKKKIIPQFEDFRSFSTVAHQGEYAMFARYAHHTGAARHDMNDLVYLSKSILENMGTTTRNSESTPTHFSLYNKKLELYPAPSSAADSTTLNGALTKTSTTITLTSVDGLATKGRGLIDNEVVSWTYIDSTNLQLTGVQRGLEGSIAAAHLTAATFTERNIIWFGAILPKFYFARPTRSATLAGSAGLCDDGSHSVYITFFSKKWGSESLLSEVDTITTASQQIDISDIPISDLDDVSHIRIYMTPAGSSTIYYVDEVENGTTTYSIIATDAVLEANSAYEKEESDVPQQFRECETEFAIGKWFWDNEQTIRARERFAKATGTINDWQDSIIDERGSAYEGFNY